MEQEIRQIALSGTPRAAIWTGRSLGAAVLLFLVLDCTTRLIELAVLKNSMGHAGNPLQLCRAVGVADLASLILATTPRLALLAVAMMLTLACGVISNLPFSLPF